MSGGGTDYRLIEVAGEELNRIIAGGESDIDLLSGETERALRIETEAGVLQDDPIKGPHFRLAADLENAFQGRTLEVTIRARASDRYAAEAFMANYSAGQIGESGWQTFELTANAADYTFTYDVPQIRGAQGVDYLAIRPVTPEKRRAVEIERIILRPLGRWIDAPAGEG